MIKIKAIMDENGIITPETPIPEDSLKIVCDGVWYTIYEKGDILPPEDPKSDILDKDITIRIDEIEKRITDLEAKIK